MRYIANFNTLELKKEQTDVLIVGSGISGLFTALNIRPDLNVLLISKQDMKTNNSYLAQGGIAVTFNPTEFESHVRDTIKAGAYYNDLEAVKVLVEEGRKNVEKLMKFGVAFDQSEGHIDFTKEGGHSQRRIIHKKDYTGKEIIDKLIDEVENRENIQQSENAFLVDVIEEENQIIGAIILMENQLVLIETQHIVLATGGIGKLFISSTNSMISTGDGIAVAHRAGAEIVDMEFIQFHPTPFNSGDQPFLISEAVRGEGGILRNVSGKAFMENYHELADLAPRDVVSRSILKEQENQNSHEIFLDVTHMEKGYFEHRFPSIFEYCMTRSVDPRKEWIPINPAEHYLMGGIKTDLNGMTSIKGLYSCGESARTGVQGANRLASNSLSEGIVFGNRVAQTINNSDKLFATISPIAFDELKAKAVDCDSEIKNLRSIMDTAANILRRMDKLSHALVSVIELNKKYESIFQCDVRFLEFKNMLTVSKLILEMAIDRPQSLGGHFLEDTDENQ
jgi:L-aspartate oxidase